MSQVSSPAKHRADVPNHGQSPQDIERQLEHTRDRLAGTLDQLLYRAHPKTIVQRKIRHTKAQFVDRQGNVRTEKVAAVAGAVVGVVAFFVVVRRVNRGKG